MTWRMVEAYGLDADTVDPAASVNSKTAGLLAALDSKRPPTLEQLRRIHVEWVKLDLQVGGTEYSYPSDRRALQDAFSKGEARILRAGAAHVLQQTWGISAKDAWLPEDTLKDLVELCEGTICPILSQNNVNQESRVDLDALWKSCWASVQQPVSKLSRSELIDRIRGFRRLACVSERVTDPAADHGLRSLVTLLERLLEMRYVLKAMKQKRVHGARRKQAKKALHRHVAKVEMALTTLEWPPEFASTEERTQ